MKEVNEKVLNHLLTNHPDLYFTLRKIDNGGRLRKGYWFLGDDGYLAFSFWNGSDWRNKTPNIIFIVRWDGTTSFELVDKEGTSKGVFFAKIAKSLNMNPKKNKGEKATYKWFVNYSLPGEDYLQAIDRFIKNGKELLDTLISLSDCSKSLASIDADDFKKSLEKINKYRDAKAASISQPSKKLPLSIQRLKLTNISHFDFVDMDLSKQVICLIGENGSGKTTILRTIIFGLIGFSNDRFVREDMEQFNSFLKIKEASLNKIAYEPNGEIELRYNTEKINKIKFGLPFAEGVDENGELRGANEVEIDDSESDFDALDDDGNFKNLVISFAQTKNVERHEIEIKDSNKGSVRDIYSLLYNTADSSFSEIQNWISETFSTNKTQAEAEKKEYDKQIIHKAFEVMSKIIGEPLILGDIEAKNNVMPLVKTPDSPNGIPLNLVSQGYENLIGWVGYLMKRLAEVNNNDEKGDFTQRPAICLIDEIDTYLHPKWQSKILSVLVQEFPNVQFIITTHSPYVVGSIPNDKVKIYVCKKENTLNEVELFDDFTAYGANITRLSKKLFQTPTRADSIDKIIEYLNNIIGGTEYRDVQADIQDILNTKEMSKFETYIKELGSNVENTDLLEIAEQGIDELKKLTSSNDEDLLSLDSFIRTKRRLKSRRQHETHP